MSTAQETENADAQTNQPAPARQPFNDQFITDDFFAALVVYPRQFIGSPVWKGGLDEIISRLKDSLLIDARMLDQLVVLLAPPTRQQLLQLAGIERAGASRAGKQTTETTTENPIPEDPDAPDLDHLFVGLAPEPEIGPLASELRWQARKMHPGLDQRLPPFAALVLHFSEPDPATHFLATLTDRFECIPQELNGQMFYQQQPLAADPDHVPLAFHVAQQRLVLIGSDAIVRRLLSGNKDSTRQLALQCRELDSPDHDLFASARMAPVAATVKNIAQMTIADATKTLDERFSLTTWVEQFETASLRVGLSQEEILEAQLEHARDDSTNQPIELTRESARWLLEQAAEILKSRDGPMTSYAALAKLIHILVEHTDVDADDKEVAILVAQPPSWSEALSELVTTALPNVQTYIRQTNLRRIWTAMVDYYDVYGWLPDNRPIGVFDDPVSWRVKLLPYLGEVELFDQYQIDEPWDGPTNRQLVEQMPKVFGESGNSTHVMIFHGPGTLFDAKRVGLEDIADELSNTVYVVRSGQDKAVLWSKPEDLPVRDKPSLGELPPNGSEAIFFDGRLTTLPNNINPELLKQLVDPRDGQPVDAGKF